MSLGVLNNLPALYAENNLNNSNNSLNTVLQQLSSGSKINSGADDAAGLSLVDGLQANQTALTQSVTNAKEGVGFLQVADGALSQVTSLLNRAVTLATEASNGTLNSSQDTAANQEYQSILSEISNIGSTTTYNAEQVFNSRTAIYTGDSTTAGSSIDDLNIRTLSSSSVGDSSGVMAYSNGMNNVFLNLSTSTQNAQATDTLNQSGTTTINLNYLVKAGQSETTASTSVTVGAGSVNPATGGTYANTANGLIAAINDAGLGLTASFTTQAQAGVQGGGNETGIQISGGLVSLGMDPNSVSTGGVVNMSGTAANQLLTQGQSITLQTGNAAAVTVAITSNIDSLATLASAINTQDTAVNATVFTNGDGTQSLSIMNKNAGAGALTINVASASATPINLAFTQGATGAAGGFATGSLGFGGPVTSSANEVVAGNIVMSNNATPGAGAITFVMGTSPASGTIAGTLSGSTFTVNGDTLGNLATALANQLGVSTTVGSSGISMTSVNSGTTLEAGTDNLTATPALAQTSNVSGVGASVGTDGSTTILMNGGPGFTAAGADAMAGSIVLTNGNATTPGTATTFTMGAGQAGIGTANVTTGARTVAGLLATINADTGTTNISAAQVNGSIVLSSTVVGTTIAVASGAANNTLIDVLAADPLTGTYNAPTASVAGASTGATVGTGVTEINSNPLSPTGNDTLAGSIIINNGTTAYTFGMAGSGIVTGGNSYLVAGDTLTALAADITTQDATTGISAAVNTEGNGLTFASTVTGESISVNATGLTDVSTMAFTTPASGSTPQYQTGVLDLTDTGRLPGSGGASTGTLIGTLTLTNNGITDTFVMGGSSQTLAADGGTITVNGSTLGSLISAVNAESQRTGSNIDVTASQDGATGGMFVQSTASGSTDMSATMTGMTDTLTEASTNGTNGAAGLPLTAANVVFTNSAGATNAATDMLAPTTTIGLTNTSAGAVVYGAGALTTSGQAGATAGEVEFIVGAGVNDANDIYTGSTAADETVGGLAAAINAASITYGLDLTATVGASGLTVTSTDNTSTLTLDATAGHGLYEGFYVAQSAQTGGAGPTGPTFASATVGTSGAVGATNSLSGSIVLNNNGGTAQTFVMGAAANVNGATITTAGYTLQDLVTAINGDVGTLGLNASVANGALALQSTTSGVDTIVVGTGANNTLADTVTAITSANSTGAPGSKSTATLNLAGGLTTAESGDTITGSITLTGATGTEVFTMGGASSTGTIAVGNSSGGETLGALAAAITNSGIGISATVTSAGLSLAGATDNATAITGTPDTLRDTTTTAALTYTPTGAYNIGISNSTGANSLYDSSSGQSLNGTNANFVADVHGSSGVATISYSDGAGVSLSATDLSNQTDAQVALTNLNAAITDVAAQDGYIGAQINTLNAVGQVLSTQQENVQAAQNAVQATDYASATSNMSKYEILSQTGIAALAQANSGQRDVLKLLQ